MTKEFRRRRRLGYTLQATGCPITVAVSTLASVQSRAPPRAAAFTLQTLPTLERLLVCYLSPPRLSLSGSRSYHWLAGLPVALGCLACSNPLFA